MSEQIKFSVTCFVTNVKNPFHLLLIETADHWLVFRDEPKYSWQTDIRLHFKTIQSEADSQGHINTSEWSWQIFNRWVDFKQDGMQTEEEESQGNNEMDESVR